MDELDRKIINALQRDFPLTERPFAAAAERLGVPSEMLMTRLHAMLASGTMTRFGPLFQLERLGGRYVLAAMSVPAEELERVARILNDRPEVAHNYERSHALNLWFVIAAETEAGITATIAAIERASGFPVYSFPKEKEYFVEFIMAA